MPFIVYFGILLYCIVSTQHLLSLPNQYSLFTFVTVYLSVFFSHFLIVYQFLVK